ncbi:Mediator of RNA polymerase II transcription subunit 28 [Homalodisca vitripennis]|nr:Mediator of RNA polymerase II transcription subunit 28 [Homalodisca vitripennis]
MELMRKEDLIKRHYEKITVWQNLLADLQSQAWAKSPAQGTAPPTMPNGQPAPPPSALQGVSPLQMQQQMQQAQQMQHQQQMHQQMQQQMQQQVLTKIITLYHFGNALTMVTASFWGQSSLPTGNSRERSVMAVGIFQINTS